MSTSHPKISVVMPAYNHQLYVGKAIEGVLNQGFSDLELIIIDDGSTDNTAQVIKSYDDPRIHYFHQHNQDAFNALNNGMKKARGDYISIINSDDIYLPDRLQTCIDACENDNKRCVITEVELIDGDNQVIDSSDHFWRQWHEKNRAHYFKYNDIYSGFLHGNFMVTTSNLFMAREVYDKIGGFCDYRYLHDYDYIFRILNEFESQTVYLHDKTLLQYRLHGSNTISDAQVIGREQDREIIRRFLKAKFTAEQQPYLDTGIDRLIQLEHELMQVHQEREVLAKKAPIDQAGDKRQLINDFSDKLTQIPSKQLGKSIAIELGRRVKHKIKALKK